MARLDALTDWERRPRRAMRVGLAPMLDLAARLGDPHRAFRSIHVAGTKGKGSVSALIEAALVRAGLAAGRYGSPHVERVNERVSVGGRDVDDGTLARGLARALDAYEAARRERTAAAEATWFDLLTAAAFVIFREAGVEWAVGRGRPRRPARLHQHRQGRDRRRHQHRARAHRNPRRDARRDRRRKGRHPEARRGSGHDPRSRRRSRPRGSGPGRRTRLPGRSRAASTRRDHRGDECRARVRRPRSARPKGRRARALASRSAPGFWTPRPASPPG